METLTINRHTMQQLLHAAMLTSKRPCMGLLTGSGNNVEGIFPLSEQMVEMSGSSISEKCATAFGGESLIGIYQSSGSNNEIDSLQTDKLCHYFTDQINKQPRYYLRLDLNHKGRMDAQSFADAGHTIPVTLEMLEEAIIYPIAATR